MYSCTSLFLYPLIPGISSAHLTTDLSYSCLSLIRFLLCATTVSFQTPVFFLCTFPQPPLTPGPTAVCLLRLLKYCKYCRVAPVVVAVEESILWINHPDRKGLAGVRKGLGHWTFSRAVETPVPTSKSIHPSIHGLHPSIHHSSAIFDERVTSLTHICWSFENIRINAVDVIFSSEDFTNRWCSIRCVENLLSV